MELKVYRPKIWDIVPTRLKEVTMLSALKLRTGSHKTAFLLLSIILILFLLHRLLVCFYLKMSFLTSNFEATMNFRTPVSQERNEIKFLILSFKFLFRLTL